MIEEILPPVVAAEEAFTDPQQVTLFAEEESVVARAVPKRRREFATVRHCARIALGRLGVPPAPILPGQRGAPRWPDGTVGSMTHCTGYRTAAVALRRDLISIGVDAEPHEVLPADVLERVSLPAERLMLARLTATVPEVYWDRLLFSVKESVYKAWYPVTGRWLDFTEAEVTFEESESRFRVALLVPGPVLDGRQWQEFTGRYLVRHGLVATAVTLPD
ncbi:MAG: 4'-phosphopantetheinyl transferase superfamily protein [Micromonosporaceae bacterium]|nr:4'-phosphopantetheinyl transferase superfamily protein [Micromonosporaceae bacterium]